jgi:acetolactate synthase-1/2/3 large subunit
MKATRFIARALEQEGVDTVFGIHGSALTPLIDEIFHNSTIQPILVRHEEGGAFMADGYARFSGKIGVCWGTSGPGTTNLLTGLATSLMDAVPVLAITGQVQTCDFYRGAFQESTSSGIDSVTLLRAVTKFAEVVATPAQLPVLLKKALRVAQTGRKGPTALVIPKDCLQAEVPIPPPAVFSYRVGNRVFDSKMVRHAAALLRKAQRPAILAGTGVSLSGANQELGRLVHLLGAGVATTPKAKGCFPEDDPHFLGILGLGGHPTASRYLFEQADLILAIGTSLGQISTNNFDHRLLEIPLIHADIDPEEIGKNYPVKVGLVGDAQVILKELTKALMDLPEEHSTRSRSEHLQGFLKRQSRLVDPHLLELDQSPILPQRAVVELRKALPRDAIVFWDSGAHNLWGVHYFEAYLPKTFTYSPNFGAMGYGVSACIGAKLARPEQVVVSVCGDGGFLMNGTEISTAVNHSIPIVWMVMNNQCLGMVQQGDQIALGRDTGTDIRHVDLVQIARGLGAQSQRVSCARDLREALHQALEANVPTVLDVHIDRTQVPPIPMLRPELLKAQ